jgi:pimeloyl-ACP methyl ester carboxylesterase
MCDRRLWSQQIAALNLPTQVADTTVADNFRDMATAVLESAPTRFALAGLSMGGILAFEIWRQAPARVTHLALLDTNPHAESTDRQSLRLQQIDEVASGRLEEIAINSLKPLYLAECHREDRELLDIILQMAIDLGPEVFRKQSLALKDRINSVGTLPTIDCPTMVICGSEDLLCPVSYHELMADRIPGAELVVIDRCGHLSSLEQPDSVSAALSELFSR